MNKSSGCGVGLSTNLKASGVSNSEKTNFTNTTGETTKNNYWITRRLRRTDRDVGPEELIVPEQRAHVFHAALLLHAVTDVRLEPGAKLDTQERRQRNQTRRKDRGAVPNRKLCSTTRTDRHEAVVQVGGVEQCPRLPGLLQDRQHHLAPQGPVKANNLLDVAEQLGRLHLRQQAALLQVEQPTQEELHVHPHGDKDVGLQLRSSTRMFGCCCADVCTYVSDDSQFLYVCGFSVQKLPYRLLLVELSPGQSLHKEQVGNQNRSWECLFKRAATVVQAEQPDQMESL